MGDVLLLLNFPSSQDHLFGIDDNHIIANINVRTVRRFMLSPEDLRYFTGDPSQSFPFGVHHIPFFLGCQLPLTSYSSVFPISRGPVLSSNTNLYIITKETASGQYFIRFIFSATQKGSEVMTLEIGRA